MRRRARGFTLTELLVVVALLVVFATAALIAVENDAGSNDLDRFARAIGNGVSLARRRAVATATTWYVDVRATSVQVCQQAPGALTTTCPNGASFEVYPAFQAGPDAKVVFFADATDTGQSPAKVAVGAGVSLTLLPSGACDSDVTTPQADGFTAYLQSALHANQKRTVTVYPLTARPRITDAW